MRGSMRPISPTRFAVGPGFHGRSKARGVAVRVWGCRELPEAGPMTALVAAVL